MIHKVKLDKGTKAELRLTKKQEYILKPLPDSPKQKLYKLIIEKSFEKAEKSSETEPKILLSQIAQGKLSDLREAFGDIFNDFFRKFKCPHCGKRV